MLFSQIVTKTKEGSTEKVLLNRVSAVARHGEMLAVVGPSGAGKSTFLDAIAGRINPSSLDGGILVNHKPMDHGFKRLSGYVMQVSCEGC
jgi:ABC-type multidrug transport system ATPase subunit